MLSMTTSPMGASKFLLLDDRNVITTDASLVFGEFKKAGAMIKEERDYEMRIDNGQPNVWYDPRCAPSVASTTSPGASTTSRRQHNQSRRQHHRPRMQCVRMKKWRAWYSAFTSCSKPKETVPFCNNAPQQCGTLAGTSSADRGTGLLYAESDDGLSWYKPNLGLTDWKGSKDNNLIELDGMTTGIYLDENAADNERYKIVTGSNGKGAAPHPIHTSQQDVHTRTPHAASLCIHTRTVCDTRTHDST